ncbi:MAG TPA: serine hydrolase domain-containing protein [Steroidobacteraceae bacterium]
MKIGLFARLTIASALLVLPGCHGNDAGSGGDNPFDVVDSAAQAAFESEGIAGMGLAVYNREGVKVFEHMYGDFTPDMRVPIASASKLVSGVTLFRLMDAGYLSLDSTTAQVLGWSGDEGAISLRQLLSFTSGLAPENRCTYDSTLTLEQCVATISQAEMIAAPGTEFDYGSVHLSVAGRMAEVVTGKSWNELFAQEVRDPLGLSADIQYYANPLKPSHTDNPLLAGGLIMSMNEYERILHFVFDKGTWQGSQLLSPGIFDTQTVEPYPDVVIGTSPAPHLRYGLTAWLDCGTPQTGCHQISSPGAFGFTPWIDRDAGYYAILGMQDMSNPRTHFGGRLEQQLAPLIVQALQATGE